MGVSSISSREALLSCVLHIGRAEANHLAHAAWGVCADEPALRLHLVRRAREVSARIAPLEAALCGVSAAPTPHTTALIAMHHYAASRDVRLLLAWEIALGEAASLFKDREAPALVAPLFKASAASDAAELLTDSDESIERFGGDVLSMFRALVDELERNSSKI